MLRAEAQQVAWIAAERRSMIRQITHFARKAGGQPGFVAGKVGSRRRRGNARQFKSALLRKMFDAGCRECSHR